MFIALAAASTAALTAAAWRTGHLGKLCEAVGEIIAALGK